MPLYLKPGVRLDNLRPQMTLAIVMVSSIDPSATITITSVSDSAKGRVSNTLHPSGNAIDFTFQDDDFMFDPELGGPDWWESELNTMFQDTDYDFVVEHDHYHLEYDPK